MRTICTIVVLVFCSASFFAQTPAVKISINNGVDTVDNDIAAVLHLWKKYLNSNPDSIYDNPYWSKDDKRRYNHFDLLRGTYFDPSIYAMMSYYKPTVLSVSEIEGGFRIRTLFSSHTDSGFAQPLCITEVVAAKEDGDYKLSNALSYNTKSWSKTNVGSITFIHPREHTFDRDLGERMSRFVDSLAMLWNIPVQPVEYYFADRLELVYKALGLDFYIGEGNHARPGGFADTHNRIVYAGGENEWYPHEFVHIYINPLFPNAHGYFLEGYATLLGGHRGKSLSWHLKRMNQYLHDHPDLNLNDLFSFWHMDFTTDPSKVFGGLLCKMAEEKGGLPAVKKLFSFGSSNDDFYRAIEEMFGVKREGLNDFLRSTIAKYAGK